MNTYEYRGFDHTGSPRRGLIEASDAKHAKEILAREGVLVERLNASGRGGRRFTREQRAGIYRELGALVDSGLPLAQAIEVLMVSPELAPLAGRIGQVRDRIRDGVQLGQALSQAECNPSAFESSIIEVAERTGRLSDVLKSLSAFMENQQRLIETVCSALIYPAFVVGLGIVAAIVMLGVLVPRAKRIVDEVGLKLPPLTRFMVGLGQWFVTWGWIVLVLAAGAGVMVAYRIRRDAAWGLRWDRLLFRLPLVGRGYQLLVNLRFSRALALLLGSGISLVEGLRLAGRATASPWCTSLLDTEAENVRHGGNIAECIARVPPLASDMTGLAHIGQMSGNLAQLLDGAANRLQDRWDRYVGRSLALLEPILILIIGGFVLLITLSVMLPVLSLTQAVRG